MPLVPVDTLLAPTMEHGFAVGYFEAWNGDSLEAVVEAAESLSSPVIIGFGGAMAEQNWFNAWGLELYAAMSAAAAKHATVPVSLVLNEVKTLQNCLDGIELGFNVVMLDSAVLAYDENVRIHRELVAAAHAKGAAVEAELGRLPTQGDDEPGRLTSPEDAKRFIEATGVDILAVSIGNVHLQLAGNSSLDFELLSEIRRVVEIPLSLHGGTGLTRESVQTAIGTGVSKFNVGTSLKKVYLDGIRSSIENSDESVHYRARGCQPGVQLLQ